MSETQTGARVSQVANVIIPIADQDGAIEFYTQKLGLELRADVPFGNGDRWIEVAPSEDAQTPIALAPPGPGGKTGELSTGVTLQTDDIEGYHALLKERGVDVDEEIMRMGDPVPPMFWFRDHEGNSLMAVEVK